MQEKDDGKQTDYQVLNTKTRDEKNIATKLMGTILQIPGAKVNRQKFLEKVLSPYIKNSEDLEKVQIARPWQIASDEVLDTIARERISYRKKLVCLKSFVAGIPGGVALFGTIPADILQYNYHLLILSQELAYLHGFPEFYDENDQATEETIQALVVMFFGVKQAIGSVGREAAEELVKRLAQGAPKRITEMKWGATPLFKAIQEIARWLGVNGGKSIGKKHIGSAAGKAIPILGGFVSAGLSAFTFSKDAKRYEEFLRSHKKVFIEADNIRS